MSNPTELPDLNLPATTDAAREYLVTWHRENLTAAPYFTDYISKTLAGDFAYHLARWLARRAQPEGEAPQAGWSVEKDAHGRFCVRDSGGARSITEEDEPTLYRFFSAQSAATLSPLCGAQHAESGKEADKVIVADAGKLKAELERAKRALVRAGFQDLGGTEWKPPLGKPPRFVTVEAQQAAAPGLLNDLRDGYASGFFASGPDDGDHRFTLHYDTAEQAEAAFMAVTSAIESSAPGTPEAPTEVEKALLELMSIVRIHSDMTEENFAWAEMQYAEEVLRAAQLDGDQEGSDHADKA